jgi:hypothetical protein
MSKISSVKSFISQKNWILVSRPISPFLGLDPLVPSVQKNFFTTCPHLTIWHQILNSRPSRDCHQIFDCGANWHRIDIFRPNELECSCIMTSSTPKPIWSSCDPRGLRKHATNFGAPVGPPLSMGRRLRPQTSSTASRDPTWVGMTPLWWTNRHFTVISNWSKRSVISALYFIIYLTLPTLWSKKSCYWPPVDSKMTSMIF